MPTAAMPLSQCDLRHAVLRVLWPRAISIQVASYHSRQFGVHPGNPGVDAERKAHHLEGHMGCKGSYHECFVPVQRSGRLRS